LREPIQKDRNQPPFVRIRPVHHQVIQRTGLNLTISHIASVGSTCVGLRFDFRSVQPQSYYLVSAIALFSLTGANSCHPCEPERTPLVVYLHEA